MVSRRWWKMVLALETLRRCYAGAWLEDAG